MSMLRYLLQRSIALILLVAVSVGNTAPAYAAARETKSRSTAASKSKSRKKTSGAKSTRKRRQSSGSDQSAAQQPERSSESVRQEQQAARQQVKQTQQQVADNSERTRQGIKRLETIEADIAVSEAAIGKCNNRIGYLNGHIMGLSDSIALLERQLATLKADYAKSLRSLRSQRQRLNGASFVFASKSFAEASRRIRYLNELDKWRKKKAARVVATARQLTDRKNQLSGARTELQQEHTTLQNAHTQLAQRRGEEANVVAELRREGKTLTTELRKQQARLDALNAELERAIAEEVRRAEAERRRRAEEERRRREAARKAKAEAEARAKAEAEAKARAKAEAEAKAKAEAEAREKTETKSKNEAKSKSPSKTESKPQVPERVESAKPAQPAVPAKPTQPAEPVKQPAPEPEVESGYAEAERKLSGSFEANKGRLLFPVAGSYKVVGAYGRHNRAGTGVVVDNRGIDVSTGAGATVRSVFDGEVVSVFRVKGTGFYAIIVRHGKYITVYSRLGSYAVRTGTQVKAGQALGTVFHDPEQDANILHFELRCESASLNPLDWIR